MPHAELTHTVRIAAPAERVFAHLADPAHYVGLSPLVVAVRDIREADGVVRYAAVERFRFLRVLRYDNVIAATLVADGAGLPRTATVSGDVRSPGGVRMAYRFTVELYGPGCVLTDVLRLRAPLGLLRFSAARARAVQIARARVLAGRLEERVSPPRPSGR